MIELTIEELETIAEWGRKVSNEWGEDRSDNELIEKIENEIERAKNEQQSKQR